MSSAANGAGVVAPDLFDPVQKRLSLPSVDEYGIIKKDHNEYVQEAAEYLSLLHNLVTEAPSNNKYAEEVLELMTLHLKRTEDVVSTLSDYVRRVKNQQQIRKEQDEFLAGNSNF